VAEALAARGIAALIEPLLTIRFIDAPALDLRDAQAILCTSANGVRALSRLSSERGLPLFAVGEASAAQARAEGFVTVASGGGDAGDLARLVGERLARSDGLLLHVSGRDVAGDLDGRLRAKGFAVERLILYEARPATALSAATRTALAARRIDAALFFSPRTAAIFAQLAAAASLTEALPAVAAVSISAATDAALAPLDFAVRRIAERPDQASLLAALADLPQAQRGR
jgi:uroporphyrinogen-III synthase